jgi:hypothetical protein
VIEPMSESGLRLDTYVWAKLELLRDLLHEAGAEDPLHLLDLAVEGELEAVGHDDYGDLGIWAGEEVARLRVMVDLFAAHDVQAALRGGLALVRQLPLPRDG